MIGPLTNRRQLLLGLAASTAAATATVAVEASASPSEAPALLALAADLAAANSALATARSDKDWLLAEWRHRWPSAPDEIAWPWSRQVDHRCCEVDLNGRPFVRPDGMKRELHDLKWLERRALEPVDVDHRGRPIKDAKRMARAAQMRQSDRKAFELGQQYYAETKRIRKASGIDAAKQRIVDAEQHLEQVAEQIMAHDAKTLSGLSLIHI